MKMKKYSGVDENVIEMLNLAEAYYYVLKINTTYYVAKSMKLGCTIKYYLLYEFSNLIKY